MRVIGVDLGFGQVKVVSGRHKRKFPSVVGVPSAYELEPSADSLVVEDDGRVYYVGEKAVMDAENGRMTLRADKTNRETDRIKYLAAIGSHRGVLHVVTGLPVYEYNQLREQLSRNLAGEFTFKYGGEERRVSVPEATVIPQSAGAYYSAILDENGGITNHELASAHVMVLDLGYRTTDIVTMRASRYLNGASFTIFSGVSQVHKEFRKLLHKNFGLVKQPAEIDDIVRTRAIKLENKHHDVSAFIAEASEPVALRLIEEVEMYVPDHRELDAILVAGGGSALFADALRDVYGGMMRVLDEPEFANALGYYRYGRLQINVG